MCNILLWLMLNHLFNLKWRGIPIAQHERHFFMYDNMLYNLNTIILNK